MPPLKLRERGQVRDDLLQFLALNVRHGRDFLGDLDAMIGSTNVAERRLLRLIDEYGAATLDEVIAEILDSAERPGARLPEELARRHFPWRIRAGRRRHGAIDVCVRATVTKKGEQVTVDLSASDPQVRGFINSSYPNTVSAVRMALAYLIDPEVPKNEGTFRAIDIKAEAGHGRVAARAGGR